MYAVIASGGKQYRVAVGDTLDVEKLTPDDDGAIALRPVMLVDDEGAVTLDKGKLADATVTARLVEQTKGPKITVFTYRNKTGYRRKSGHRQHLTRIRVDDISL
ncbi:MAG: 50S ribosomal protein L21 [Euzebyales bacterium]|jgi:large subunit ribosomal protein L21|nr:50S ribosomal protein L21 [Euzebyales bacterium]